MRGDLYIHIGSPKTGTTAIQHFLTANREKLAAQGVLYPVGGALRAAHHILGASVFPGRASLLAGVPPKEAFESSIAAILEEIESTKPAKVVLSTEYLWGNLAPAKIRRLLQPFADWRIHILVYLRRQDLLAQSLYLQAVKGGYSRTFDEWLKNALDGEKAGFFFDQVLDAWQDSGVPLTITPRAYEKGQFEGDIRLDFMNLVAPGADVDYPDEDRMVNTTPDMETIAIVRLLNAKLDQSEVSNRLRRRILTQAPPREMFAPLSYFEAGEAAAFLTQFSDCNEKVARKFFGREDGVLFRETAGRGVHETVSSDMVLERLVSILPNLIVLPQRPAKPAKVKRPGPKREKAAAS
jgi:hypothetical protein